jgi:hypothetical protein
MWEQANPHLLPLNAATTDQQLYDFIQWRAYKNNAATS